jgi:hypothetical protein
MTGWLARSGWLGDWVSDWVTVSSLSFSLSKTRGEEMSTSDSLRDYIGDSGDSGDITVVTWQWWQWCGDSVAVVTAMTVVTVVTGVSVVGWQVVTVDSGAVVTVVTVVTNVFRLKEIWKFRKFWVSLQKLPVRGIGWTLLFFIWNYHII